MNAAIKKMDKEAVSLLLEAGSDPDAIGFGAASPIVRAVIDGNFDAVNQLLDAGVDINTPLGWPGNQPTLMSYSVASGNMDLLENLLVRKADANAGDVYGWTPLMDAVHRQDLAMVKRLLPVSDPTIFSKKPITETDFEKQFDRNYPIGSAIFFAEQFNTNDGKHILRLINARASDFGGPPETLLAQLDNKKSKAKLAFKEFRIADGLEASNTALALLSKETMTPASDAALVNHAIWFALASHELSVVSGSNLSQKNREFTENLFAMGSHTKKWHDMLDVLHIASTKNPQSEINQWQQDHGKPPHNGWDYALLIEWIESFDNTTARDRLYDALDFFELN